MTETYIIRILLDGKQKETAKATSKEASMKLIRDSDTSMTKLGYRKVSFSKVRIDKKHITTITLDYSRP